MLVKQWVWIVRNLHSCVWVLKGGSRKVCCKRDELRASLLPACTLLCACRFAEYRKDDPASFLLHQNLSYFPQFMFNMRRSPFVQVRVYMLWGGCVGVRVGAL